MIELTLKELVDSIEVWQTIITKNMTGKLAYKIANIIEVVEKENIKYNKIRNDLIQKYGKKDENDVLIETNGTYTILPEYINDFNKEITALAEMNILLPAAQLEIPELEFLELSPTQALKIMKYIKKEEA